MATPSEILTAIQPFLTEANKINPGQPMETSYGVLGVYIYKLPTNPPVLVYTSSAAIDCDGQATIECTGTTDPLYQSDTSCHQSDGLPLIASQLPFYVIPQTPNPIFNYPDHNISCGQVGLVLYGNNMNYGVFGDERGRDAGNADGLEMGEVSYAMAASIGIDPNPNTGGVENGVTYIIFTGTSNVAYPIENHNSAVSVGNSALNTMLSQLSGGGGGGGGVTCTPPCLPTQICLLGTCVEKKYITYGAIGFGALFILSMLKR